MGNTSLHQWLPGLYPTKLFIKLRSLNLGIQHWQQLRKTFSSNLQHFSGKTVNLAYEEVNVDGRHVLLVDDICDTGLTLLKLHKVFLTEGAKSVSSAVLIHRDVEESKYEPTWGAFMYSGTDWFVGYGLDDEGRSRTLPEVYVIEK